MGDLKILYITEGNFPDYQSDMILHGLRVLDYNVVDFPKPWYMYKDLKDKYWGDRIPDKGKGYGMGFTITGLFINDNIDRSNIEEKIIDHFFDLIIYGSCRRNLQFLDKVKDIYKKKEIIFIDGEDHTHIGFELSDIGIYFKRELISENRKINHIGFSFPKEKVFNGIIDKEYFFAKMDPRNKSTYIYNNENDYYNGYRLSYFGITMKKAGWDCLRHYEIIANRCLPYFLDIDDCPYRTMVFFPKEICKQIKQDIHNNTMYEEKYINYLNDVINHFNDYLTTDKMAEYLIKKVYEKL